MDALFYLLAFVIVAAAAIAIVKTSGVAIPQPLLILIYAVAALICLSFLWHYAPGFGPHR